MNTDTQPLFSGIYSYRRPSVAIAGTFLVLIMGGILGQFIRAGLRYPPVGKDLWAALFAVSIVGLLFCCGCYLVIAFLRRHSLQTEITDEGVSFGSRFFPWSRVRWISARYDRGRYQLAMGLRGFAPDRQLVTDNGLSEEEYDGLVAVLQARLSAAYPRLQIG